MDNDEFMAIAGSVKLITADGRIPNGRTVIGTGNGRCCKRGKGRADNAKLRGHGGFHRGFGFCLHQPSERQWLPIEILAVVTSQRWQIQWDASTIIFARCPVAHLTSPPYQ